MRGGTNNGTLTLDLDKSLEAFDRARLELHVCDDVFKLKDATENTTSHQYAWASSGLDWTVRRPLTRSVKLTVPRPPALQRAVTSATVLIVQYDETLDTASVPAASAFSLRANDASTATVSAVAIEGSEVRLTLGAALSRTTGWYVSYTRASSGGLRGSDGDEVRTSRDTPVANLSNDYATLDPVSPDDALLSNLEQSGSASVGTESPTTRPRAVVRHRSARRAAERGADPDGARVRRNDTDGVDSQRLPSGPGTRVQALRAPPSVDTTSATPEDFTSHGLDLDPNTIYWVVVKDDAPGLVYLAGASSNAADVARSGWRFVNNHMRYSNGTWSFAADATRC